MLYCGTRGTSVGFHVKPTVGMATALLSNSHRRAGSNSRPLPRRRERSPCRVRRRLRSDAALPASEDCYQTTMSSWNRRPTVEMRLHDEESGFSPSSVHMPSIKKGQLIHRFDVLRQSLLCVWAIALSTSEQVSRETMENNRVRRASTRAVACQRRKTCFAGVGRSRCRSWHLEQELVCGGETHCRDNGDAGSSRGVHHL